MPLSSVPVQFIAKIITPPSCSILPEVLLTGESCTPIKVNETFISQLLGINNCRQNVTITDISILSFPGMNQGSLTKLTSLLYYKTLTWTPKIDSNASRMFASNLNDPRKNIFKMSFEESNSSIGLLNPGSSLFTIDNQKLSSKLQQINRNTDVRVKRVSKINSKIQNTHMFTIQNR
ncbi:unnamed protein product [Rotaria magnacalcarata]